MVAHLELGVVWVAQVVPVETSWPEALMVAHPEPAERKRFEVEAVVAVRLVAKRLVVVALEPVAFTKVKFWRVEEARTSKLVVVAWPFTVSPPP